MASTEHKLEDFCHTTVMALVNTVLLESLSMPRMPIRSKADAAKPQKMLFHEISVREPE